MKNKRTSSALGNILKLMITRIFIFSFGLLQGNFLSDTGLIQTEEQKVREMLNYSNEKVNELSKKNLKRLFTYESQYKQSFQHHS